MIVHSDGDAEHFVHDNRTYDALGSPGTRGHGMFEVPEHVGVHLITHVPGFHKGDRAACPVLKAAQTGASYRYDGPPIAAIGDDADVAALQREYLQSLDQELVKTRRARQDVEALRDELAEQVAAGRTEPSAGAETSEDSPGEDSVAYVGGDNLGQSEDELDGDGTDEDSGNDLDFS